jgi:ppGpp synthetase/RelA/SpoT-type nucleotidyltranferase
VALTELQIATLVERYTRERDRFEKMAATVTRHLSARLRAAAIPHLPTFRSKDPESLRGKLNRDRHEHDFVAFEREFAPAILDLAGVRILLYRPKDVEPTCSVIEDLFVVPEEPRYRKDFTDTKRYQARHRVVSLRDDQIENDPALANLRGVRCEIQVVTLVDHIWNELEHDIKYKTPHGQPTEEQKALLASLRTELDAVRDSVNRLMDATDRQRAEGLRVIETAEDLRYALGRRCNRWFAGDFERLLELLDAVLREVTPAALDKLPLAPANLADGAALLAKAGISAADDDLGIVVAALWPQYGADFVEVVKSWRGKTGRLSRLVRALDQAATGRKIGGVDA